MDTGTTMEIDQAIVYDGMVAKPRTDFLYTEFIDEKVTDALVDFYHTQDIFEGGEGQTIDDNGGGMVDTTIKDSMDYPIFVGINDRRVRDFTDEVNRVCHNYAERFPLCTKTNMWKMEEFFNLQYYKPGGGYHLWHCERQSSSRSNTYRHLVWMVYLNDVPNGGTEFFHQQQYIEAEKAKCAIWPSDWTWHHKGRKSETHEKIIATGWYHFI